MDSWDEDFREPTEDERSARRILALAIALINARRPLSSVEIHREFYPDMSYVTFRKTFLRDRERLVVAGLSLRNGARVDDVATWEIDAESSFVKDNTLTDQDAFTLDLLLLPLATDPSYPYAHDLRLALTKIDRSFDGYSTAAIPPEARKRNSNFSKLEECMSVRHNARISYVRADATKVDRTVSPLGFFHLNGNIYMVAASPESPDESPHTYNLERVKSVREQKSTYDWPVDFDIRDFILLPFQIGSTLYRAEFKMKDGSVRTEEVCDEGMAAAWAIAHGAKPLSPSSLCDEWTSRLLRFAKEA